MAKCEIMAPKRVPNRLAKVEYLSLKQGFCCEIAKNKGYYANCDEIHHAMIHNTKVNRKLYPRLVHSLWNLMLVSHNEHMRNGSYGRISNREAAKREAFLRRHPCIAKKLNMED